MPILTGRLTAKERERERERTQKEFRETGSGMERKKIEYGFAQHAREKNGDKTFAIDG